jgi:hypothetical protein
MSDAPLMTLMYTDVYKGGHISWMEILLIIIVCFVLATVTFMDSRS